MHNDYVDVRVMGRCEGVIVNVVGDVDEAEIGRRIKFVKQDAYNVNISDDKSETYCSLAKGKYSYA